MLVVRLEVGAKQDVRSMIVYAGPPSWTVEVMRALYGTPSSDSGSDVFDWLIRLERKNGAERHEPGRGVDRRDTAAAEVHAYRVYHASRCT